MPTRVLDDISKEITAAVGQAHLGNLATTDIAAG